MSSGENAAETGEKPFWLRPPWMILFDLMRLHRIRPWDVNVSYLLTTLLGEMRKRGYIDFTASGIALLSSATIYRMKSELILELQEPPKPRAERPIEFLPPPIQLPYRHEYTSTTIEHLLDALEYALKREGSLEIKPKLIPITPAPPMFQELDRFMLDIEDHVEEMYQRIVRLTKKEKTIPFSKLIAGLKKLEAIRSLLLILFIACSDKIRLWQEEEFGEIYISLPEEGVEIGGTEIGVI